MKRADGGVVAGSALGAAGAAIAALFGTLCCAGSAVVALLGAGGALAAARIEPYRPYLLGAAVAMLAFGFWRAYRPARGGAACAVRTGRWVRIMLWCSAALVVGSALAPRLLASRKIEGSRSPYVALGANAEAVRAAFNADGGRVRLVVLVSPS
jgi:hypothetical protein